jgi:hypothetical protein
VTFILPAKSFNAFVVFIFASHLMAVEPDSRPLDPVVGTGNFWETPSESFAEQNASLGFHWTSRDKDVAESTSSGLKFLNIPVYQAIVRFETGKPKEITLSIFNRGDAGTLPREQFEALLKSAIAALSDHTKAKPAVRGKDAANAVKAEGIEWQDATTHYVLEYSFVREVKTRQIPFRAEFVRLQMTPVPKTQSLIDKAFSSEKSGKFSGATHVRKDPNGDVALAGIPMVDQGEKGYCVVATAERVLRYYGSQVDEHELAQIANSSATGGTSTQAMFESLKKVAGRLHVKVRTVEPFEVKEILDLVRDYNRIAKRGKRATEIDTSSHALDVQDIYARMDKEVLREARTKSKSDVDRFEREIEAHVNQGIPLLWCVMIGITPEPGIRPGTLGGHMRLIIGYNPKTDEILYSDSWGAGHELKRMPLADAWTMTTCVNAIEPL